MTRQVEKELKKKLLSLFKEEADELEIIEEGEWTQDYKYQNCETIGKYEGKFYSFCQSRSGSYHTDWYYNDTEVYEVTPVEKIVKTTEWVVVKNETGSEKGSSGDSSQVLPASAPAVS